MIRKALSGCFRRQQYQPGFMGLFLNPFYFARKGLYQNIAGLSGALAGRILDVGCGQKPYAHLFCSTAYVGLEIDTPENRRTKQADCFYDGTHFPFPDGDFDGVIVSEVLEHVFTPDVFLREINRVVKPGGLLLLTVPFCWDEHEQPYDYARYSSFGVRKLLADHGFRTLEQRKSVSDIRAIAQLFTGYVYKVTGAQKSLPRLAGAMVLIIPCTLAGELLARLLPRNADFYLDNIVLAQKRESLHPDAGCSGGRRHGSGEV